jgi:hypothetical protein
VILDLSRYSDDNSKIILCSDRECYWQDTSERRQVTMPAG